MAALVRLPTCEGFHAMFVRTALLFVAIVGVISAGCSGSYPGEGVAASVQIVSGDAQTGVVATELAQPVVVKVVDVRGAPAAGSLVVFVVTSGGGSVFAGSTVTDKDGIAQDRWT